MGFDFEYIKKIAFENIDDDEDQKKVLEDIEKLKTMSEVEIQDIVDMWNRFYNEYLVDSDNGRAAKIADKEMLKLYLKVYPNENEDEYNQDLFEDFYCEDENWTKKSKPYFRSYK